MRRISRKEQQVASTFTVRIPEENQVELILHWKQLRLVEGLSPEFDLTGGEMLDRFDGTALIEWVMPASEAILPILTAVLGFLSARRGEVEYTTGDKSWKFRNVRPRDIERITHILRKGDDPE